MSAFIREATVHLHVDRLKECPVVVVPVSHKQARIEETILCEETGGVRCLHLMIRDMAEDPLDTTNKIVLEFVLRTGHLTPIPQPSKNLVRVVTTKDGRYRWYVFLRDPGAELPAKALYAPEACTSVGAPPALREGIRTNAPVSPGGFSAPASRPPVLRPDEQLIQTRPDAVRRP